MHFLVKLISDYQHLLNGGSEGRDTPRYTHNLPSVWSDFNARPLISASVAREPPPPGTRLTPPRLFLGVECDESDDENGGKERRRIIQQMYTDEVRFM